MHFDYPFQRYGHSSVVVVAVPVVVVIVVAVPVVDGGDVEKKKHPVRPASNVLLCPDTTGK